MKKTMAVTATAVAVFALSAFCLQQGWLQWPRLPNLSGAVGTTLSKSITSQFQTQSWVGNLEKLESGPLDQVVVRHNLSPAELPPTEDWVELHPLLSLRLWDHEGHSAKVLAKSYTYQIGCDSAPTFRLQEAAPVGAWNFVTPINDKWDWSLAANDLQISNVETTELSSTEWEKLKLSLQHQTPDSKPNPVEVPESSSAQPQFSVSALKINGSDHYLFADLTLGGQQAHRMYTVPSTGENRPVDSALGVSDWPFSFRPSEPVLTSTKRGNGASHLLIVHPPQDPDPSAVLVLDSRFEIEKFHAFLGREDCE